MIERTGQRGVPQFFIDGRWIGGYDDLAYLNATGELDQLFGIAATVDLTRVWDVAVVGGGPAGLTAALYAARKNLATILITMDLGGQVGVTHLVTNYPGIPVIEGPELVRLMFEQAYMYGLERMIGERVTGVRVDGRAKVLELQSGKEIKARAVIVASGAEKRRLEVPGESEFGGRGVVYCSTCDGPFYRDKTIAIVGGGNSALEAAIEMSGIAKKVYVVSRGEWSGDEVLQDKAGSASGVKKLDGLRAFGDPRPRGRREARPAQPAQRQAADAQGGRRLHRGRPVAQLGLHARPRPHQPARRGRGRRHG